MRRYSLFLGTVLVLSCIIIWACVDKIRIEAPDQPDSGLLIQGRLIVGSPNKVSLYIAELYKYNRNLPRAIGGAEVSLENDQGQSLPLKASGDGNYFLDIPVGSTSLAIQADNQYRVAIKMPNGTRYFSAWEPLLEGPKIDALHFSISDKEVIAYNGLIDTLPHVNLTLDTRVVDASGNRVRLLWDPLQVYKITDNLGVSCYATRKILDDLVPILDGRNTPNTVLSAYPLLETPLDYRFAEGFYFSIVQAAISEDTYGYFEELNQILARKGTLFDAPAGEISTNIYNPDNPHELTYGRFWVIKPDTLRLNVSPAAAGYPRPYCPLLPRRVLPRRSACDDCIVESGAQYQKPYWWQ